MIGMTFGGFIVMLVCGIIAAIVLHYAAGYRFLPGADGFLFTWVAGWVGAWVGAQVIGHWWFAIAGYYAIPALIGAFMLGFACTAVAKARALWMAGRWGMEGHTPIDTGRAA
ncbi:MAG: hypothetical protein ACRD27_08765 [Terracidiphilus sp.]